MNKRIGLVVFSPTDTTRRICFEISRGMGNQNPAIIDTTRPEVREELINGSFDFEQVDHIIVGAPVYSGKLPLQIIEVLGKIAAVKKTTATAVVVYGNRDYGVSLHTMVSLLTEAGFSVNSAGIFIGEHSYSDIIPIAIDRPDDSDLKKAFEFGNSINNACSNISNIPIQLDRVSRSEKYTALKPVYNPELCRECGKCSSLCPCNLISGNGSYRYAEAEEMCIGCMACVKGCPCDGRSAKVNSMIKLAMKQILKEAATTRKEPVTILP